MNPWKCRKTPGSLALLALLVAPASAQLPPATFDRAAAASYALAHNPDLLAAQAQLTAAESHRVQVGAYPNPILSGLVQGYNPNNQTQLQIMLGVTQTFQLTRQIDHKRDLADLETKSAQWQLALARQTTLLNTKQAYNQALSARHALVLADESVRWNRELARIAHDKVKLGDLAAIEAIRADVAVGSAQQDLLSAKQTYDAALAQLRVAMGRMDPLTLPPDHGYAVALLRLPSLEELVQQGLAHRPEVAVAIATLQHEVVNERLIRSTILPSFDFVMGAGTYGGLPSGPNAAVPGANVGINIGLPLWYRQDGEIDQSRATQAALSFARTSTENTLRAQIEAAYEQVETSESQIKLYQASLMPDAKRLLEQTRERYLYGDASGRELQEAHKTLRETETAFTRAYLDYRNAVANLEASVGQALLLPNE